MSAIIVSNTVTTQLAIQNAARARQQHIAACTNILSNGSSPQNSVQDIQAYSECVQFMYPKETSNDVVSMKIIVAALLLSALIGAIVGVVKHESYEWIEGIVIGALGGLSVIMVGGMILLGVMFVFS